MKESILEGARPGDRVIKMIQDRDMRTRRVPGVIEIARSAAREHGTASTPAAQFKEDRVVAFIHFAREKK